MKLFDNFDYILITGPSGCGKSTLLNEILSTFPDKAELQKKWTTRPVRPNTDTYDSKYEYCHVSEQDIDLLDQHGLFFNVTRFKVSNGDTWLYGFPKYIGSTRDMTRCQVLGCGDIARFCDAYGGDWIPYNCMIINFVMSRDDIREKLIDRGDNEAELNRRLNDDFLQFNHIDPSALSTLPPDMTKMFHNKNSVVVNVYNSNYSLSPSDIISILTDILPIDDNLTSIIISPRITTVGYPITDARETHKKLNFAKNDNLS